MYFYLLDEPKHYRQPHLASKDMCQSRGEDVMSLLSCPFLFQFLWLNISAEQEVFQYKANLLYLHKTIYMLTHTMYAKEMLRTSQETLLSSDIALFLL